LVAEPLIETKTWHPLTLAVTGWGTKRAQTKRAAKPRFRIG
jgi:hypothetical protein